MDTAILRRIARDERFKADALVARIAVDYLEPLVKELLMHHRPAEVRAAVSRRLKQGSPKNRERVAAVFLQCCAPTRCAEIDWRASRA